MKATGTQSEDSREKEDCNMFESKQGHRHLTLQETVL